MTQPEFDLGLTPSEPRQHRREGEPGGGRERKAPDPEAVAWRRVHTMERCHVCIDLQHQHLDGADGSPHVAWPASYIRTEGTSREALCFEHAAPRRAGEGLSPQRSSDPNAPGNRKPKPAPRADSYE